MDKKRLGTFVLGGLTGVVAGVLLAPRSGRETRGTIANRAGEARQRGRESYFDTRERFGERVSARRNAPDRKKREEGADFPEVSPEPESEPSGTGRPYLRDVSRGAPQEDVPGEGSPSAARLEDARSEDARLEDARSEELRRKVRETRARLRSRAQEEEGTEDAGEE